MKLPHGFTPITFAAFDAAYPQMVRDISQALGLPLDVVAISNTIRDLADPFGPKSQVLQFATHIDGTPAVFTAPRNRARERALTEKLPSSLVGGARVLTTAEVVDAIVSWFDQSETISAITAAASSIPHETPLSSIETPNVGAGWFWFGDLMLTGPNALLWGWTERIDPDSRERVPAIAFSPYVFGPKGAITSSRWHWPLHLTFVEMLAFNETQIARQNLTDDVETVAWLRKKIHDLSLFFVMACLWFRQTVPGTKRRVEPILEKTDGEMKPLDRHRMQTKYGLEARPTVSVVALRKSERVPRDPSEPTTAGTREYHCRWIVAGHPRLQKCGPGRKDTKLIWIKPYPKGPDDKPLKTRERVYAVVR